MMFSVIMPCYNVRDRIRESIDSVLNQSIGLDEIQLILVDDASTDGTQLILQEYEKEYPENILLILCEQNGFQGTARNIGLEYATGEWVCFVDADDKIHKDMFLTLANAAKASPKSEIISYGFAYNEKDLEKDITYRAGMLTEYDLCDIEERRKLLFRDDVINNSCTQKIYKTDLIKRSGVKYAEKLNYEEPLFTYPLKYMAAHIAKIDINPYFYHLNPKGTINSRLKDPATIGDHIQVQTMLYEFLSSKDFFEDYRFEIELNFLYRVICETKAFLEGRGFLVPDSLWSEISQHTINLIPMWQENPYLDLIPEEEKHVICDVLKIL